MTRKFFSCVALFFPKLRAEKLVGTWKYVNYQIFTNLKNRPPRKLFHNARLDLRNTRIENRLFLSFSNLRLVLMFRKTSNVLLVTRKTLRLDCFKTSRESIIWDWQTETGGDFVELAQLNGSVRTGFFAWLCGLSWKTIGCGFPGVCCYGNCKSWKC